MRSQRVPWWFAVAAMLVLPTIAYAQEATLSGTVKDTTGGALPGVTVRAVHEATGNSFQAVTDERGGYRLPVRVGAYRVTAELTGFAPATRAVTLLLSQEAVVNLEMAVSGVEEALTVTAQAPLLDLTQSSLGGNIDPRQMEELPVLGRNWSDLSILAPGARINAVTERPVSYAGTSRGADFALNVDGQQVHQVFSGSDADRQPRFSKDAIGEFEYKSSRFDATQGRSFGVQINAITKSGSNTPSGSFSGYFRDDRFNAADFVAKRVLPYEEQQLSGTFGGPIRKDKVHFFGHYEYDRQPATFIYTTPYSHFNRDLESLDKDHKAGGKLDVQLSPRTRLTTRGIWYRLRQPYSPEDTGGSDRNPSSAKGYTAAMNNFYGTLTQVLSNRVVNEFKVGFAGFGEKAVCYAMNANARSFQNGCGAVEIFLQGLAVGGFEIYPDEVNQDVYSVRDDFTFSFVKGGRHTLKLGAEYLHTVFDKLSCVQCNGEMDASNGPIPPNIESLFPNLFDATTWILNPLSPLVLTYRQVFGDYHVLADKGVAGVWVQDDWALSPRLTVNLGLRYDLELNAFGNDKEVDPRFLPGNRPNDANNVGPRVGFAYSLNDRTVLRGGYGLYFGTINFPHRTYYLARTIAAETLNDGRPDFASNPYNGPLPTTEDALARACTPALPPGCLTKSSPSSNLPYPGYQIPYSHQPAIGVQRQLGSSMVVEADYVYMGFRNVPGNQNINLTYNPATGTNYPSATVSRRPYPDWGNLSMTFSDGRTNLHSLQTAFSKRLSHGWQASGTYTLSGMWSASPLPRSGLERVPFPTAPDLGGEYGLAPNDQRHRGVFNGIWQLPYGFQLSGLYFFGSGLRRNTTWGPDLRRVGGGGESRLRPDGTIVPRNHFVGDPIHRVDVRLQRRFPLGRRAAIDGIVEVFNAFNHANYGSYNTQEVSVNYGQPDQNTNNAYAPRMLQLGFRATF